MVVEGRAIARDLTAAERYYQRACDLGRKIACAQREVVATLLGAPRPLRAPSQLREACRVGAADACHWLSVELTSGYEITPDLPGGTKFLLHACRLGVADACYLAGVFHTFGFGVAVDGERASAAFRLACDRGSQRGCERAGRSK